MKTTIYAFDNGITIYKTGSMSRAEIKVYEIENNCKLIKKEIVKM